MRYGSPMTTTYTDTVPLALVPLPSGNTAAIVFTVSLEGIVIGLLLLALVLLHIVQMWRTRRTA